MIEFKTHPARLEAQEMGVTRFDPGRPCPHGHTSLRYTSNTVCCECASIASRKGGSAQRQPFTNSANDKARRIKAAHDNGAKVPSLPARAITALVGYAESGTGRANSQYLDGLIRKLHQPQPEPVTPTTPKRRSRQGTSENRFRERYSERSE